MTGPCDKHKDRLPDFNDRADYRKSRNIEDSEVAEYRRSRRYMPLIDRYLEERDTPVQDLRILDFGCGRGLLVAFLRSKGFDAYGVDISEKYVSASRAYFSRNYQNENVLSVIGDDSRTSFDDGYFDIILSDQVLEHVEHLAHVAREVSRLLKTGGVALLILPPRRGLIEPHMKIPFVHWLPKRTVRMLAIGFFLFLGIGKNYFAEYRLRDRSRIFYQYSVDHTFYRSNPDIARCFESFGLRCDISEAVRAHLANKFGSRWAPLLRIPVLRHMLVAMYANFWSLCIYCWR